MPRPRNNRGQFGTTNLYTCRSLANLGKVWAIGNKCFCKQIARDISCNNVGVFYDIGTARKRKG